MVLQKQTSVLQYCAFRIAQQSANLRARRRNIMQRFLALALAFTAPLVPASPAMAEARQDGSVTTMVVIKTPAGVSRQQLEAGFKQSVPLYESIPGLVRKYYIVDGSSFGGVYLWKDRASAEAWYSEAWRAKAKATYGVEPQLVWFDTPLQLDRVAAGVSK
jgi:hypothetical protein